MVNHIELLAPAGDWDAFLAAVENGADAVYLGGKLFNARQFAGNFDEEELNKALDYAHARGVSVYLTMNTLMSDSELSQGVDFATAAYKMGIDGIIVQDLGFARLIRNLLPELPLHASTQMTIYDIEGVRQLEKLGFTRAVLARELSLREIKAITENSPLEIEIFIHGALCISYSGQCLMSSILGGRSGNRGKCAQPCRQPYDLLGGINDKGKGELAAEARFLMSPKDLCSINELQLVVNSGVKSLKIEGRMKNPEYVANVVRLYRKYIDRIVGQAKQNVQVEKEDMKDLLQTFNRGGFGDGYLNGKKGRDMMSYEKPKNWGIPLGEIISYDERRLSARIRLSEKLAIGDGIEVWNGDDESPGTVVSGILVGANRVESAEGGQIVDVTRIKGRIYAGNKVYKTSDKALSAFARQTYTGRSTRKSGLKAEFILKASVPPSFKVEDKQGNTIAVTGSVIPEPALNRPISKERIEEQLGKTGASPFRLSELKVILDENLSLPVSELNDIRRRALEEMEQRIVGAYKRDLPQQYVEIKNKLFDFPGNSRKKTRHLNISLLFYNIGKETDFPGLGAERLYIPFQAMLDIDVKKKLEAFRESEGEIFIWLPAITRGNYDRLIKDRLGGFVEWGISGVLIGNIGSLEYVREYPQLKLIADYSMNIFNSFSVEQAAHFGCKGVTLSPELNLGQINELKKIPEIDKEALVYGRMPLMISEYCPVGSVRGGCGKEQECSRPCIRGEYLLEDRMGMKFPVLCDRIDCRSMIMNSNVMFLNDGLEKLKSSGIDSIRLNITDEKPSEIIELIGLHRAILEKDESKLSRYDGIIKRIKNKGFTRGHYFRGV